MERRGQETQDIWSMYACWSSSMNPSGQAPRTFFLARRLYSSLKAVFLRPRFLTPSRGGRRRRPPREGVSQVPLRIDLMPSVAYLPAEASSHAVSGWRPRSPLDHSGRHRLLYVMALSTIHMMTLRHSTLEAGWASEPF